jgi:hypothetical protein
MERQPITGNNEQKPQLKEAIEAPYVSTIRKEARDKIEGHDRSLSFIFNDINNQAIDSFEVYQSEKYPGVSFSTIHLSVTPELIKRLTDNYPFPQEENPSETKDQTWFIEPAIGFGDIGNAFSALDIGIDRFIREMPKVSRALKNGETPPKIDIFVLGSPIAFGGTVTSDWNKEVAETGFDAHGKLYADFVERNLPEDLDNTRVVVTGPSRGSLTSERTYHFLPEEIKVHTQGLYDIPVGTHLDILPSQFVKSANMAVGMGAELGVRMVADRTTKDLGKTEGPFYKKLRELKDIPTDSKEQSGLKLSASKHELMTLAKGTKPDLEERGYYRAPDLDPTNIKPEGLIDRGLSFIRRRPFAFRSKGNKLIISTSRKAHNFPWKKSFDRWESILEYCETPTK